MSTSKAKQIQKPMEKEDTSSGDLIVETVKEIGELDKESALEIVPALLESADFTYFKLGGVLSTIQENDWWVEQGSPTFRKFVEEHFGMHYRKALYMIKIYDGLVNADVPWDKVSMLGWTKLKELADILTPDNVDEWVTKAMGMNTLTLKAAVQAFKQQSDGGVGDPEPETSGVSTMSFTVHPDQKETITEAIEQVMEDTGTEFKSVALESICMNFLAGGSTKEAPKPLSLRATLEKHGVENVLEAFDAVWPEINLTAEIE